MTSRARWKAELLALEPGEHHWLNGIPVCRLPCSGTWFNVGTHDAYPEGFAQRLPLSAAIERVRSGYYPWLRQGPAPDRLCEHCGAVKRHRWMGAFKWCMSCVKLVCLDCWNAHSELHEAVAHGF